NIDTIANNIIAYNSSGLFRETSVATANFFTTNNLVFGNTLFNYSNTVASSSDLAVAPQFVNRDAGDYHLLAASPAIDAGNNLYVQGTVDIDNESRIQGARVDVGADEYLPPNVPPDVAMTAPAPGATYRDPATITLSASATD